MRYTEYLKLLINSYKFYRCVTGNNKSKMLFKEKYTNILLKRCLIKRLFNILLDNVKNMRNYTITLSFALYHNELIKKINIAWNFKIE